MGNSIDSNESKHKQETVIQHFYLKNNPPQAFSKIECPYCKFEHIDDGLELDVACPVCKNVYQYIKGKIYRKLMKKQNYKIEKAYLYNQGSNIPNLKEIILYCNKESWIKVQKESNKQINQKIDYFKIRDKFLIPYFQKKMRIIKPGQIFNVEELEFKAFYSEPSFGKITKQTKIYCFKEFAPKQFIERLIIGRPLNIQSESINEQQMLRFLTEKKFKHLSIGQQVETNQNDITVYHSEPDNGIIYQQTRVYFSDQEIQKLSRIEILLRKESISDLISQTKLSKSSIQNQEKGVSELFIIPFLVDFQKLVYQSSIINFANIQLIIDSCEPKQFGIVTRDTQFQIKYIDNITFNQKKMFHEGINTTQNLNQSQSTQRTNTEQIMQYEDEEFKINDINERNTTNSIYLSRYQRSLSTQNSQLQHQNQNDNNTQNININLTRNIRLNTLSQGNNRNVHILIRNPQNLLNNNNNNNNNNNPDVNNNNSVNSNYNNSNSNENNDEVLNQEQEIRRRELMFENLILRRLIIPNLIVAIRNDRNNDTVHTQLDFQLQNLSNMIDSSVNELQLLQNLQIITGGLGQQGATKYQINRLPLRKINMEFIKNKQNDDFDYIKCQICLNEYVQDEVVRTLPCLHYFHNECIDQWLGNSKQCPICKTMIDIDQKYQESQDQDISQEQDTN